MRISDDRTGDAQGVERQDADCRELAGRHGWPVVKVYRENDTSAFKRRKVKLPDGTTALRVVRPAFRELLADIADGTITALVAYDLDRVARDPRDLEDLIDAVELKGIPAVAVSGSLDLSTDAGITMARVQVAIANKSSRDTSRRVSRAMLSLAEQGAPTGGRRPFGYAEDRVTVLEEEAQHVRWAYEQVLAGRSLRSVAIALQQQAPSRVWDADAVKQALLRPRNAGLRQHRGQVLGPASWPGLVDQETWERARAVLEGRPVPGRAVGGPRRYLLTGLLVCGRCGDDEHPVPLYPRRNADRQRFGCLPTASGGCGGNLVVYEPCEELVVRLVLDRLERQVDPAPDEPEDPSGPLLAELARLERRQDELAAAFAADDDGDAFAFRSASRALRDRMDGVRAQLRETQRRQHVQEPLLVRERWPSWDLPQRRAVVEAVLQHVVVGPAVGGGPRFRPERIRPVWR